MIDFKGRTHILIGVSVYSLFFPFDLSLVLAVVLGSLFPDIDIATSKLGKYNPLTPFMKHRGRMHTLLILGLIALPLSQINTSMAKGFFFGYLMHLVADTFTPRGIMWLYPFSKKYFSLARKINFRKLEPLIVIICSVTIFVKFLEVFIYGSLIYGAFKISRNLIKA